MRQSYPYCFLATLLVAIFAYSVEGAGAEIAFKVRPCEGGAEILGFNGAFSDENLVIPKTVALHDGDKETQSPVVKIGDAAFERCEKIVSIEFPGTLKEIGGAFFIERVPYGNAGPLQQANNGYSLDTSYPITVDFSTSGTATLSSDYIVQRADGSTSMTATIPANGTQSPAFSVIPLFDNVIESSETVYIDISELSDPIQNNLFHIGNSDSITIYDQASSNNELPSPPSGIGNATLLDGVSSSAVVENPSEDVDDTLAIAFNEVENVPNASNVPRRLLKESNQTLRMSHTKSQTNERKTSLVVDEEFVDGINDNIETMQLSPI